MNAIGTGDIATAEITIQAPAERIFEALTDPAQRVRWWTAGGRFKASHMESDLRPGGTWMLRGIGIGGKSFRVGGEYRRIERPHLLEFTWLPDWQQDATETLIRIDLTEHDGITTVRLTHSGLITEAARASHRGWPELLISLRAYAEATANPGQGWWSEGAGTTSRLLTNEEKRAVARVRYLVTDVERAIAFYTQHLGFKLEHQSGSAFASVSRGDLTLLLSGLESSGHRPLPDGRRQHPGWNRIVLNVDDLTSRLAALKRAGLSFRSDIVTGPRGKQVQLEDPDGNPIELFEPAS